MRSKPNRSIGARRPLSLLAVTAGALLLMAACATGSSGSSSDDDDDDGSGGQQAGPGGAGGTGGGGGASSSSGTGGVGGPRTPQPGDFVIAEFMPDPSAVDDESGEWLELANVSGDILRLENCRLYDLNPTPDEVFFGPGLTVAPGDRAVIGRSTQATLNGGIDGVLLAYSTAFTLANESDEIILECATGIIDQVAYDGSWPFSPGVSAQLRASSLSASDNDAASSWCMATDSYGMGDMGSPGDDAACQ